MAAFTRTHGTMTFSQACDILRNAKRNGLKDRSFGDSELYWTDDEGNEVATGYLGHESSVCIGDSCFGKETARILCRMGRNGVMEYQGEGRDW